MASDRPATRRPYKGCVALMAAPVLIVLAPAAALYRTRAERRRGSAVRTRVVRRAVGGFGSVRWEFDVPHRRVAEVVRVLAGCASSAGAQLGLRVGCVGLSPVEEPVLAAIAPRRDLIAEAFVRRLLEGEARARRQLWLSLSPGVYLAEVIDPYKPVAGDEAQVLELLSRNLARHAVLFGAERRTDSTLITVEVYASRRDLRGFVSLVHEAFEGRTERPRQR